MHCCFVLPSRSSPTEPPGFNCNISFPPLFENFLTGIKVVNLDIIPSLGLNCRFNSFDCAFLLSLKFLSACVSTNFLCSALSFVVSSFFELIFLVWRTHTYLYCCLVAPPPKPMCRHQQDARNHRWSHHCIGLPGCGVLWEHCHREDKDKEFARSTRGYHGHVRGSR